MSDSRQWRLEPKTEFRFELEYDESITVKLKQGRAEIFGAELPIDRSYLFNSECKAAIFTWHGCTLEIKYVSGRASAEYVAEETPMTPYANCHIALEKMRVKVSAHLRNHIEDVAFPETEPPCVLVLGPENSGKTTACKILLNYALRSGQSWSPLVVNLALLDGAWTAPGTVSACHIGLPVLTTTGTNPFGSTTTSAPSSLMLSALLPLVYWFGHLEAKQNPDLMHRIIRTLASNVDLHLNNNPRAAAAGTIIDTPAAFSIAAPAAGQAADKFPYVTTCVDAFGVNVILVVGNEKLNVEMQRRYNRADRHITVIKVPKSGGTVDIDASLRRRLLAQQLRTYFYGYRLTTERQPAETAGVDAMDTHDTTLAPTSSVIGFSDLTIYRFGQETMAPSSALPIGASRVISAIQPVPVDPGLPAHQSRLLNAVLALLAPLPSVSVMDDSILRLLDQNVVGFIVITAIDHENQKMTVLAPSGASLEGRTAILGSMEWQET